MVAASAKTVIRQWELLLTGEPTLYHALRRLRPDVFQPRRPTPQAPAGVFPSVYLDERYFGDLTALLDLPSQMVRHVEVVSAVHATFRFGRQLPAGAIVVSQRF